MEMALHSSDVSQQTRGFNTVLTWTYLLFEEFFAQGDLEKEEELPISYLCDRATVKVAPNQPGFVNVIVLPIWTTMKEIMPALEK